MFSVFSWRKIMYVRISVSVSAISQNELENICKDPILYIPNLFPLYFGNNLKTLFEFQAVN